MKLVKRWCVFIFCFSYMPFIWADKYSELYEAAGWPVQIDHFEQALLTTQKQYKDVLPSFVYESMVLFSIQQFPVDDMKQRGEQVFKTELANPDPALSFFRSDLGMKIVSEETKATSVENLKKNQNGVPVIEISNERRKLFNQLIAAIPYNQTAVEVSSALISVVSDTLNTWLPNVGAGNAIKQMLPSKQQIQQQVNAHLDEIVIYVYRNLSDKELQQFVSFAESSAGKAYYQVAQKSINASLNK